MYKEIPHLIVMKRRHEIRRKTGEKRTRRLEEKLISYEEEERLIEKSHHETDSKSALFA